VLFSRYDSLQFATICLVIATTRFTIYDCVCQQGSQILTGPGCKARPSFSEQVNTGTTNLT